MDVLTSETCWALNKEIIKQVTSSWSLFIQVIFFFLFTYLLTYLLTPWSRALLEKLTGSQQVKKFPALYGTPKVYYHIHNCPPTVPILNQFDPVHALTSHFLKIHPNIFLQYTPGFPHLNPVYSFPLHPNVLHDLPILFFSIWSPEQYWMRLHIIKLLIMYFSPIPCFLVDS